METQHTCQQNSIHQTTTGTRAGAAGTGPLAWSPTSWSSLKTSNPASTSSLGGGIVRRPPRCGRTAPMSTSSLETQLVSSRPGYICFVAQTSANLNLYNLSFFQMQILHSTFPHCFPWIRINLDGQSGSFSEEANSIIHSVTMFCIGHELRSWSILTKFMIMNNY